MLTQKEETGRYDKTYQEISHEPEDFDERSSEMSNKRAAMQEINMRYESRFLFMSFAIAGLALSGCKASNAGDRAAANQDITVTCTSTVAYDIGTCQILANARCEGEKAQLRGVLSSTFLPANKLYLNTARYRCQAA